MTNNTDGDVLAPNLSAYLLLLPPSTLKKGLLNDNLPAAYYASVFDLRMYVPDMVSKGLSLMNG
ncbi:MAG: hypothetical protein NTY15_01245 [Planctomycetota bacterium]|nr:hypothetical protein [Planctomycetota bacterium]